MGIFQEFKAFAMRGNVVDLAVGVVIGGAFGNIVKSLVEDIITPPLNYLTKKADFKDLRLELYLPDLTDAGKALMAGEKPAFTKVSISNYGSFIQAVVNFLIVAFCVFMVVKLMNKLKKKQEVEPAAPPPTPEDIMLLREIRDSLAKSAPRRAE